MNQVNASRLSQSALDRKNSKPPVLAPASASLRGSSPREEKKEEEKKGLGEVDATRVGKASNMAALFEQKGINPLFPLCWRSPPKLSVGQVVDPLSLPKKPPRKMSFASDETPQLVPAMQVTPPAAVRLFLHFSRDLSSYCDFHPCSSSSSKPLRLLSRFLRRSRCASRRSARPFKTVSSALPSRYSIVDRRSSFQRYIIIFLLRKRNCRIATREVLVRSQKHSHFSVSFLICWCNLRGSVSSCGNFHYHRHWSGDAAARGQDDLPHHALAFWRCCSSYKTISCSSYSVLFCF